MCGLMNLLPRSACKGLFLCPSLRLLCVLQSSLSVADGVCSGRRVAWMYLLFTCMEHPRTFVLISSWHFYYEDDLCLFIFWKTIRVFA